MFCIIGVYIFEDIRNPVLYLTRADFVYLEINNNICVFIYQRICISVYIYILCANYIGDVISTPDIIDGKVTDIEIDFYNPLKLTYDSHFVSKNYTSYLKNQSNNFPAPLVSFVFENIHKIKF